MPLTNCNCCRSSEMQGHEAIHNENGENVLVKKGVAESVASHEAKGSSQVSRPSLSWRT